MKTKYDKTADAIYINFSDAPVVESEEVRSGFVFDFDSSGRIVGIEVIDASKYISLDINSSIDATATDGSDVVAQAPLQPTDDSALSFYEAQLDPHSNPKGRPLAWMTLIQDRDGKPWIDTPLYDAAERFRTDLETSALAPNENQINKNSKVGQASSANSMITARQQVRYVLHAVGSDLTGLLIDVCGFGKRFDRIESERKWPIYSAIVVVRIALERLADYYRQDRPDFTYSIDLQKEKLDKDLEDIVIKNLGLSP